MTVVSTTQDPDRLTVTIVADLAAPPTRVWRLWADPRLLEQWWGPPTWPARFTEHDLTPGGRSLYVMTGPDGEQAHGWWRVVAVDPPRSLTFEDGFADDTGAPNADLPTTTGVVTLEESAGGTRMTITSRFRSPEQMQQLVDMGMVEGMTAAMGQMDALVAV